MMLYHRRHLDDDGKEVGDPRETLYSRILACVDDAVSGAMLVVEELQSMYYRRCCLDAHAGDERLCLNDSIAAAMNATKELLGFPKTCCGAIKEALLQWPVVVSGSEEVITVPVRAAVTILHFFCTAGGTAALSWALGRNPALLIASAVSLDTAVSHCNPTVLQLCFGVRVEDLTTQSMPCMQIIIANAMGIANAVLMHAALKARVWRIRGILTDCAEFYMDGGDDRLVMNVIEDWHAFVSCDSSFQPSDAVKPEWTDLMECASRWSLMRRAWIMAACASAHVAASEEPLARKRRQ